MPRARHLRSPQKVPTESHCFAAIPNRPRPANSKCRIPQTAEYDWFCIDPCTWHTAKSTRFRTICLHRSLPQSGHVLASRRGSRSGSVAREELPTGRPTNDAQGGSDNSAPRYAFPFVGISKVVSGSDRTIDRGAPRVPHLRVGPVHGRRRTVCSATQARSLLTPDSDYGRRPESLRPKCARMRRCQPNGL